jgi:RNA polymerase sigma-70 factor (ECF subfamily)
MLSADVELVGDGGGRARAIPRPMVGAAAVAKAIAAFYGQIDKLGVTIELAWVNGDPGFCVRDPDGRLAAVAALELAGDRVAGIYSVVNPDKLRHLGEISTIGLRPQVSRSR